MSVIITGGKGFIGGAVCRELQHRGIPFGVLDKNVGDVRDYVSYELVAQELPTAVTNVIHLAGVLGTHELFDTPFEAVDVNVNGTLQALEYCRKNDAGFTGITMPQVFPSIYTATKIGSTALATAYNHTHGVPVSHVRAFNAFGPRQAHGPGHPQKIVPTFAYNIWNGIPVPVWGDGEQTVDLIHTHDLGRMLVDAMGFGDNQTFDGGTGRPFTVNEVVKMVGDSVAMLGGPKEWEIDYLPMRRGEKPTTIVAEGEGWDLLDWRPEFHTEDLLNTVEWYRDYVLHEAD